MKEILSKIFEEHNFRLVNFPQEIQSLFAVSKDMDKVNYYLVLFVDDLYLGTDTDFESLYSDVKSLEYYDHQTDKNLTLVVCLKRNSLKPDENLSNRIYQIEEDPYFFKKYVLTYTDNQVELIKNLISSKDSITNIFYKTLNNHDLFLQFKKAPYKETQYNLISKLFIKIPFLNLRSSYRQLDNLSEKISNSLDANQAKLRDKTLEYVNTFKSEDNLRSTMLSFIGEEDMDGRV